MPNDTGDRAIRTLAPPKRQFVFDGATTTFAMTGEDSKGELAIIHSIIPPGAGSAPHVHSREEETAYVLKGVLRVETEGQIFDLTAGSAKVLPRSIPHRLSNTSEEETQMLLICTPAGFEGLVRETAEFLEKQGINDGRPTADQRDDCEKIATKHGVSIVAEDQL